MDKSNRDILSSRQSEENGTPITDLIPISTKTIRDYDKEFQDLKRENFNLKLRIYFLEEQSQPNEYPTSTTYIQQLENDNEGFRRRLRSQTDQTTYNFDQDDERRALREELEKYRRENEYLRQSLQLSSDKIHVDEREKLPTTTASVDSGLDTVTPGMSSTRLSSHLQLQLNDHKEHERKLEEKINILQKQLDSFISQSNETRTELDHARKQIKQYETEIKNYEQRQSKSERVLQRLQADYESRIANLVEQQRRQLANYENYQHEQDQTSPNVNIDEYRQTIEERDRIIRQLEETINEITNRLRTPFTMKLPFQVQTSASTDDRNQNLIQELNTQMRTHLETIDQLRAECVELRRSETHLRNQIDNLTDLISAPTRTPGLPPLPRPSTKINDTIEDAQQLEDLQTAVVQITLQLQTDAENVSGLTNRVAQIIRDRDEWQERINRLQEEIEEKNAHIRQLEKREPEVEDRIRQQFLLKIEILQRDVKTLQEQLKDRDRLLNEYEQEKAETRKDYQKFDNIHNQERENLQEQLQTIKKHSNDLEEQLVDERRRFDELQTKYEKVKTSTEDQVEEMEKEIQRQQKHIEEFNLQIREVENSFQLERRQLERETNIEKERNIEIQNTLEVTQRRLSDFQNQFEREREQSDNEIQDLRRDNQTIKARSRELEDTITDLIRKNDEFKSQISIYENRFRDNEDNDQQYRNEITRLQRDIQDITRENEDRAHEVHEWRRKYETISTELNNLRQEKDRIDSENQTMNTENLRLQRDIDELTIQIRVQIQQEYEEQYRQLVVSKETDIGNIRKDNDAIRNDFEQLNIERTRLEEQLRTVENSLKQANETIESYETDMAHLREALKTSKEQNDNLAQDMSRAYIDELQMKTERLHDLETRYRSIEIELNQSEKTIQDLRQENTRLLEQNQQLQHEYEQYRIQRTDDDDNTNQKNVTSFEERGQKEVLQTTENKQDLIDKLENELREKNKIIKELQHARSSYQRKDRELELKIEIEQDLGEQDLSIQTHTDISPDRDQQILHDKTSTIQEYERRIDQLETVIRDLERLLDNTNDKFQQQTDTQQRELEDYRQKRDSLVIDLNLARKENKVHIDQIEILNNQLNMLQNRNQTPDQVLQSKNTIDDLRSKLRQREESIQTLQRTVADSDRDLRETRQNQSNIQSDYNRAQLRYEQMEKKYAADLEERDRTIAHLQKRIADKDQDINRLQRENDTNSEAISTMTRSKSRELDDNSKSQYSATRAPTNAEYVLKVQQKDEKINELQRELERVRKELEQARREESPSRRDDSSAIQYAQRVEIRRRPLSKKFDELNREELLYELEMALQDNEGLVQQLAKKSPNITELHNQLLDVRKELARQKYVNQVLWRKLDALIDIQGSNTRAELAIELANYHDELEALKAKQHRFNDARSVLLNPISRSSSGLIDRSSIRQRRYSSEDFQRKSSLKFKSDENLDDFHPNNIEDLQEIIRNQNKYIEQLKIRIRINMHDHPHTSDQLIEQNKNLYVIINNYKNELKKLNKTIELNRKTLQQYENIIKQQQNYIHSNQFGRNAIMTDDLQINLNIDILPLTDNLTQTSLNKKDSGVDSVVESTRYTITQQEYQRHINDKDEQIKQLTKQFNDIKKQHEAEISQYRLKVEKAQTDLIDDLDSKQNDLRQARLQIEVLKASKVQLDQAQDQNQRLQTEIKLLQNELASKKELSVHYEKQIGLLEKQISASDRGTGQIPVRISEMAELLEEMRRLRHDLERSINKQNELQAKLDENIRLSRTPREFTFSGRGVSHPDLRIIDATGSVGTETISFTSTIDDKRSRPLGSSTTELDPEQIYPVKKYVVGELETHENLRKVIGDLRIELKALEVKIKEKLRSKFTTTLTEPSVEWLEHRLKTVALCLRRLEETAQFVELYWKANLPMKNKYDEHPFSDQRLAIENKELKVSQSKCFQELQNIRQKYKEQSIYMDQVLAQLTKSNSKKANADDYLTLLLRPTLDVLQKARSNMEYHLKESNNSVCPLSDNVQFYPRQRTNHLD